MSILAATIQDIPVLVPLINSAYRGEDSKKGWTTEANLLKGELRTDIPSLTNLLSNPAAAILKYYSDQKQKDHAYNSPARTRKIMVQGRKLIKRMQKIKAQHLLR